MDGMNQLESQILGVRDAIFQLKSEVERQHSKKEGWYKTTETVALTDTVAITASSKIMKGLSESLLNLAEEVETTAYDQMLLESLWFDNIRTRRENVATSHPKTFQWLLNPSSDFENWLRSQSGIYWIRGKAGSGKSTLMKFLIDHPRTEEALKAWAERNILVTASFFFWNAGTTMQKSQIGLFKSLLYEILRQCPDLIRTVCASKAATFQPFARQLTPWTQHELRYTIEQLKHQSGSGIKARFCFFIDGLDEYDGDTDHIIEILESFRSWPHVKMCVSSRPWNEFIDAFGGTSLYLALEDLTREDIKVYVEDTLEKNQRFRTLTSRDSRSQDLVQEIVEKARGVFLWVVLVVKSLLTGLRNADRIFDLQKRLRDFPETLETYFGHILNSVEATYREETARVFKYALEAEEPLSLLTYSFLDEENLDDVLASTASVISTKDILSRQEDMQRRLNARCKGLLEVVGERDLGRAPREIIYALKVDFLHRTAYDFLLTKDMQNMLAEELKADFEPKTLFCKALFAQMKRLDYSATGDVFEASNRRPIDLLEDLVYYASKLEVKLSVSQTILMDEVNAFVSKRASAFDLAEDKAGYLSFLVRRQLYIYVQEVLTRKKAPAISTRTALLAAALDLRETKYVSRDSLGYDTKMIGILLEHGAKPNGIIDGITVWSQFLRAINAVPRTRKKAIVQTIELLLIHGADPWTRVVVGQERFAFREETRRVADLQRRETVDRIVESAETILKRVLGEAKAREVLSKARPQQQSLASRSDETFLARMREWLSIPWRAERREKGGERVRMMRETARMGMGMRMEKGYGGGGFGE